MAKAKKSEGAEVRQAFDGPKLDHDELIGHIGARIKEEHERSSDGSESAAKVAAFIEKTGINSQAYSWLKTILKKLPKKDGQSKAMDIIRSLKAGLPLIENEVAGQSTVEMNLEPAADEKPKAEKETAAPVEEQIKKFTPKVVKPAKKPEGDIQQEADDFESHLAAASE